MDNQANQAALGQSLQGGILQSLPPSAGLPEVVVLLNQMVSTLNERLTTNVLADASVKRFLFGYQVGGFPDGDFGMKISAPKFDVTTALYGQTPPQLLFVWDFTTNTQYWYDPITGLNYMQEGELPDGTGGWDVAAPGYNVADGSH